MKIFSNLMNEEIDIEAIETSDGVLLSHESLKKFYLNNAPRFKYSLVPDHICNTHSVYRCVMEDTETGKYVEEIGESLPESLDNDISKKYPSLMSAKRAFDEAMITILQLPGKYYSNQQILSANSVSGNPPADSVSEKQESAGIKETIDGDGTDVEPVLSGGEEKTSIFPDEVDLDNIPEFVLLFSISKGRNFSDVYNDKSRWEGLKGWIKKTPNLKMDDDKMEQLEFIRKIIEKEDGGR